MWVLIIPVLVVAVFGGYTEKEAVLFMKKVNHEFRLVHSKYIYARWNYELSLTQEDADKEETASEKESKYIADIWAELIKFPWKNFKDPMLKRQFFIMSQLDEAALPEEKRKRLADVLNEMEGIYSKAKLREFESQDSKPTLTINDVAEKFASEYRDACRMAYYWQGWHDTVGKAERSLFLEYVELSNEEAKLNNFTNYAELWHSSFETKDFEEEMSKLMDKIRPLFEELHAYIRRKLWLAHGKNSDIIDLEGPIPASLLGNMWGLDGINIYNITVPFPNKTSVDVSPQLQAQNYTGLKMAKTAEKFYMSLNMSAMTNTFWKYSIFKRPEDKDIECSPTAYNFYNGRDFRIKFCTTPTMDDFGVMHHEMGHIENYMIYRNLPFVFQESANLGFSEAIGDLMYIYALNPLYLKTLGLLDSNFHMDKELEINTLFQKALSIVFFLPYAYSLDVWRWRVFRGDIDPEHINQEYWNIRLKEQGVVPPVKRDEDDLDPAAKYHVVNDYQYISYFVSGILEFQFHKALCETAGEYKPDDPSTKPLFLCNIYNSTAAGNKLKKMMSLGKSHKWPDALEIVTGTRKMDASPLLEFFKPLYNWLKVENEKNHETIGWNTSLKYHHGTKVKNNPSTDSCSYH